MAQKHVSRASPPHPWEKGGSQHALFRFCQGPAAPPGPWHPCHPALLFLPCSPGGRNTSPLALAFLEAWRTVAQVLSCKHVGLGCSKMLQQCGSKAVKELLCSPKSTTVAAEQRHRAQQVKGSILAP